MQNVRPGLDTRLAAGHSNRGDPLDSSNARAGKAFAGLVAEMGKPLDEWTTGDVEKTLPKVDATMPVFPR